MTFWLVSGFAFAVLLYFGFPWLLRRLIRKRLQGYIRVANEVDAERPRELSREKRVAVLGAGVAGLTAAVTLARRGYKVSLREKNEYLGGKLGSWREEISPGVETWVSHGFHAFFPHYYNLNRFLDSLDLRSSFASVGDYVIIGRGGDTLRFANLDTTPVFNLFSLMRAGMFSLGDALKAPGRDLYGVFLEYDRDETFEKLDGLSYAEFAEKAQVPPRLKLAFNTFARAFFADEDKLSFAELVKSFHFYYLSQDGGLVYDYPTQDYDESLLKPLAAELEKHGAMVETARPCHSLNREGEGWLVDGEKFDKVVVATDVVGASKILGAAEGVPDETQSRLRQLKAGQRYSVYRLWLDKDVREDIPVFVITEKLRVLDSVTTYHRFESHAQEDLRVLQDQGSAAVSVLELHCYSVPDDLPDGEVKQAFFDELCEFFPELRGAKIIHEAFQLRSDFTAFHVGLDKTRPETETGASGLVCAGDWVKLPFPAMLLEGACASGLWAANALLREDGLQEEEVLSVPLRGLMAGMPAPPARKVLYE